MNTKLLAIALIALLPVAVNAQAQAAKPAAKEHRMQNSDPTPDKEDPKPEHVMRNDNPSPKHEAPKPEHVMKNN